MKSGYIKYCLVLPILLATNFSLRASHIVGGELTYAFVSVSGTNYTYKFTLNLYRDSASGTQFTANENIYIYKSNGYTDLGLNPPPVATVSLTEISGGQIGTTVPFTPYSPCFTPPSGIGVKKAVYTGTVTLPEINGGYTAIFQRCCRNANILNYAVGTNTTGSTYKCIMPGTGNALDSSPVFKVLPPIAICQNELFTYDCGATDADGDALTYSLYDPFDCPSGALPGGYSPLTSQGGYSLANLVGGLPVLNINSSTGILTCYPPVQGRFLVGIRVDEYRNGVYIGSVFRDFQFNIQPCNATVTSNIPTNHTSGGVSYILSCNNLSKVQFTNGSSPIYNISTFFWDFGDTSHNDTSNLKAPSWTYSDTGTYTATLVMNPFAYGSSCSDTTHVMVKVYHRNNADFYYIASPQTTCVPFIFRDTSTGSPTPLTYHWNFGDGTTSTLKDPPAHVYLTGGTYTVTEIVENGGQCYDTVKKTIVVSSAYPSAAVLSNGLNCKSLSNTFQNIASAANYNWFFGDPTTFADTSHLATPTYIYPSAGTYSVELIVNIGFGGHCQDTAYQTFSVYPPFKVGYTYSPNLWCINMPIQFTDTSSGYVAPDNWYWNFGDGDTSHHQNPTHTFLTPGTFNIKLIAQNSKGCTDSMTITKTIYLVANANIIAPTLNCYSNTVSFQTTGIAQKYFWDFGDTAVNDTSWHLQPTYNYLDTGVHIVRLILNPGATGTCIDTGYAMIKVYAPFKVGYGYTPPYICRRNMVQFIDTSKSIATLTHWTWKLNDSIFSTVQNSLHQFNDTGRFQIKLVIQNSVGCHDSITQTLGVFAPPKALIGAPTLVCSGLTVGFQSLTYSGGYFWNFGDTVANDTSWHFAPTYTYSDTGTFTTMFVVNPGAQDSCSDTAYATVKVFGPIVPKFVWFHSYNCPNHIIQFTDTSTSPVMPNQWLWNFGDSTTSTVKRPTHIYKKAGNYVVKLIVYDSKGCMDSIVHTIVIDTQTHSNIIVPTMNCDSVVHFKTNAVATYEWNFGEPISGALNTDSIKNPTHNYHSSGTYTVRLIVYPNTGCADTAYQTIQSEFFIKANFIPINVCIYDSAEFFNTATTGAGSLTPTHWYFGDGSSMSSSASFVKHIYATANTYQVKQVVTNNFGCEDSITKSVTIYPIPVINAGRDTSICNLDTISLEAYGGSNYAWTPNYAIDDTTSSFPLVTPDVTTKYFVTVITADGCIAQDSVLITNVNPKTDGVTFDTTMCYGDTIHLKVPVHVGDKYVWTPFTGLDSDTSHYPSANLFASVVYQIYIRNGNCIRYDTNIVKVKPLARPDAGDDITICNNLSITLHATHGTFYSWTPTQYMLNSNTANPIVYPKSTTTYYVTVIDTTVCLKPETDSMIVFVDKFKAGEVQNDTNILKNIPAVLNVYGGTTYLWMPSTGLSDSTSATPTCIIQHDQVYVVKILDGNGCYNYDTLHVYVFPNPIVLIPNAFSPNGDGLDDVIMPVYAGIRTLDHYNIYNRWGQLMFSTTEINQGWDGTFKGVAQPMDTYVYSIQGIDVEGNGFNQKGDITLVR